MIDEGKRAEFVKELIVLEDDYKPIDPITVRAKLSIEYNKLAVKRGQINAKVSGTGCCCYWRCKRTRF